MKTALAIFIWTLSSFFITENQDLMVDVVNSFRKKDAGIIAAHFNSNLEVDIPGNKGMYSSGQAKVILQQYFDNNNPSEVKLSHSGNSASGSKFAIVDFKVNMSSKQAKIYTNSSNKISEIKIE